MDARKEVLKHVTKLLFYENIFSVAVEFSIPTPTNVCVFALLLSIYFVCKIVSTK